MITEWRQVGQNDQEKTDNDQEKTDREERDEDVKHRMNTRERQST